MERQVKRAGRKPKNITGQTFKYFLVLGYAGKGKWHCLCQCGNYRLMETGKLTSKNSKTVSCGCYSRVKSTKHGYAKKQPGRRISVEYATFISAKQRCSNPNSGQFNDYGGRGIEFRFESFNEFIAEVGNKPSPQHSIDRIDVNGHYEKGNLRWATRTEQNQNQRRHQEKHSNE